GGIDGRQRSGAVAADRDYGHLARAREERAHRDDAIRPLMGSEHREGIAVISGDESANDVAGQAHGGLSRTRRATGKPGRRAPAGSAGSPSRDSVTSRQPENRSRYTPPSSRPPSEIQVSPHTSVPSGSRPSNPVKRAESRGITAIAALESS